MKPHRDDPMEDEAAEWLARRHFGLTPAESQELNSWLASDARRREAFARLELAWRTLNEPRAAGQGEVALAELVRRRRGRHRRRWGAAMATVAAVTTAWLVAWLPARNFPRATVPQPTAFAHPDIRHFSDGSVAELNSGTELTSDFTAAERDVDLSRGEALFLVAHDAAHPFVVFAGGVTVRAVGTAFNVRLGQDAVEVLVTEGKVRVDLPRGLRAEEPIAVAAGEQIRIALAGAGAAPPPVTAVSDAGIRRALEWRSSRIEFSRAPLAKVVDVFNRKNSVRLVVGDAAIRDLQISGIYWSDDPEGFVRLLNEGLDLRAEHGDGVIILRSPL